LTISTISQLRDSLPLNRATLVVVSEHTEVVISELATSHMLQELLVMSDDDELEVLLVTTVVDDLIERDC
jgi:hypothetical protein